MRGADGRIIDAASSRRGTPGQVLKTLLLACAIGALIGSSSIIGWTRDLPDSRVTAWAQGAAGRWNQDVAQFGLNRPWNHLHALVRGMRVHGG